MFAFPGEDEKESAGFWSELGGKVEVTFEVGPLDSSRHNHHMDIYVYPFTFFALLTDNLPVMCERSMR